MADFLFSEGSWKNRRVKIVLLAQLPETKVFWKDFHASKRVITPFMVNQGQILSCLEDTKPYPHLKIQGLGSSDPSIFCLAVLFHGVGLLESAT